MHLLDPVGTVMEDLPPYVDSHSASRTTFRLKLGNKGLARLKDLESAKVAVVPSTPVVAADVPATSPAELSGWSARNFTKGKQAEKNIYRWFEVFPALWDKCYPCPLLTGEGLQLPSKEIVDWKELCVRAPLFFELTIKANPANWGAQVTWQLAALVPKRDLPEIQDFCVSMMFLVGLLLGIPCVKPSLRKRNFQSYVGLIFV